MAGPFVVLRKPDGSPLLAWGSDELRVNAGLRAAYRAVVLTAEGLQDPHRRLEAQGLRVLRCGYLDIGNLAQAQAAVTRCAPQAARWVAAGIPTLVLCAAGENRSALMTAHIRWLVTGQPGAEIVAAMKGVANPTCPGRPGGCVFKNGVFRRWAESWPAVEGSPFTTDASGWLKWGVAGGLVAATLWILWRTLRI